MDDNDNDIEIRRASETELQGSNVDVFGVFLSGFLGGIVFTTYVEEKWTVDDLKDLYERLCRPTIRSDTSVDLDDMR